MATFIKYSFANNNKNISPPFQFVYLDAILDVGIYKIINLTLGESLTDNCFPLQNKTKYTLNKFILSY